MNLKIKDREFFIELRGKMLLGIAGLTQDLKAGEEVWLLPDERRIRNL